MGIAGFLDIFQGKMSELMESLEYAQAYLDDLLCILLEDHLEILQVVLRCLCDAGLKVDTEQATFCTLEIEYLGFIPLRNLRQLILS
jgi:hypothetical protein